MAGNSLGSLFRITTFGESHGGGVGVLIDGVKPNMPFDPADIQRELNRRRPGQSSVTTARNEADEVQILSGVFDGKTLGTPICMLVWNKDQNSKAYDKIKDLFRPGHAAYTYLSKYGIQDYRGGGRSSGRETIGRVAAGALAKKILDERGIEIIAYTKSVGNITAKTIDYKQIEQNPVRCPDAVAAEKMRRKILAVKKEGDSIGGVVEAVIRNCPVGLGEPVFDKLEADLAKALMSIPALKGYEVGNGFAASKLLGSQNNDAFYKEKKSGKVRTGTNNAGGILGGISNGEDIVVRVAVKPPSSILKPMDTVDTKGRATTIRTEGRHDPCLCPRVVPVVESMIALVISDHLLRQELMKGAPTIRRVREEINFLDRMLLVILSQRQELVKQVGAWKKANNVPILDAKREKEILNEILEIVKETELNPDYITALYKSIFADSRAQQQKASK